MSQAGLQSLAPALLLTCMSRGDLLEHTMPVRNGGSSSHRALLRWITTEFNGRGLTRMTSPCESCHQRCCHHFVVTVVLGAIQTIVADHVFTLSAKNRAAQP